MQINSVGMLSFKKTYKNINPTPNTQPPLPPGNTKLNTNYTYIQKEDNVEELALNENPTPNTQPPLPPGYKSYGFEAEG